MMPPFVQVIHREVEKLEKAAEDNNVEGMDLYYLTRAVLLLVKTIATIAGRHDG